MNNAKIFGIAIKRPSIYNYLAEPFRAIRERVRLASFLRKFKSKTKGDGHPVIVIPGFMGGDRSVKSLTRVLKKSGYQAKTWGMGINLGNLEDLDKLSDKLEKIFEKTNQKISLVGWSLGGVYGREMAKKHPEKIRQVITLCSPFNGVDEPNNAEWIFSLLNRGKRIEDLDAEWLNEVPTPADVPTTAFYSRKDGVVAWQTCMEKNEDRIHQNIEIDGSHVGVIFNKEVLPIILDRLQYREENWKKYNS